MDWTDEAQEAESKGGNMYTKKEREYYNEQRERTCQRLGITKNQYNWLRRKGEALHRIYEFQCSGQDDMGYSSDKTQARWERWENDHYTNVNKYIEKLSRFSRQLFVYFQTDPRGATVYVDREAIPENNYTNAVCIY